MGYKIVITLEAKEDLERFIKYLVKNIFHELQDYENKMH